MDLPVLGRRVRQRRKELGMSQEELASGAGMSKSNVTNIEAGRQERLSRQKVPGMSRALQVTEDILNQWSIGTDVEPPPAKRRRVGPPAQEIAPLSGGEQSVEVRALEGRLERLLTRLETGEMAPADHLVELLRLCPKEQRDWVFGAVDQLRAEV